MGSVQTYETVHMVTVGNGNNNKIIGNLVVDPFYDISGVGKKHTYATVAVSHHMNSLICLH